MPSHDTSAQSFPPTVRDDLARSEAVRQESERLWLNFNKATTNTLRLYETGPPGTDKQPSLQYWSKCATDLAKHLNDMKRHGGDWGYEIDAHTAYAMERFSGIIEKHFLRELYSSCLLPTQDNPTGQVQSVPDEVLTSLKHMLKQGARKNAINSKMKEEGRLVNERIMQRRTRELITSERGSSEPEFRPGSDPNNPYVCREAPDIDELYVVPPGVNENYYGLFAMTDTHLR